MKSIYFLFLSAIIAAACQSDETPPAAYGPVPTKEQLAWQQLEQYMFVHFGPNTFTNVEWGDGKEHPQVFNPTHLDCRQWARIAKAAGLKGIIITAKHHDGFCLWPSKYSAHTVRESKWQNGQGDVLRELSAACKEYHLKFGVYLSPWDRNHPTYGTPEYNQVFANTLGEVLRSYGDLFEQWLDGACGEGPNGKRQEYDWALFHKTIYEHQPHAVIFSDVGPGCRWVGNERGVAGMTNWSTLNVTGFTPGYGAPPSDTLNAGNMNGEKWIPAEVDVSIRPGWFYSPETDDKVKTVDELLSIYYTSVGRNANLLLNVPPDRSGRIHPNDSARLIEWRAALDESFAENMALNTTVKASNTRGKNFAANKLTDGNTESYWATNNDVRTASIEIDLASEKEFNCIVLQEYIALGQRIKRFSVSYFDGKTWLAIDKQTTIGYKRILRFPAVKARKLKIDIEEALACPVLNEIGVYKTIDAGTNT